MTGDTFRFRSAAVGPLPLTVDGITNDEHTVFGAAVPLAVSLAMILTAVAYKTVKAPRPPFFPTFPWMTVKHGLFAHGIIITFAVLWQRFASSIVVSPTTAIVILGLVVGVVSGMIRSRQAATDPERLLTNLIPILD